jgi:uncharacterized protein YndB with AHSA1/START domain
MSKNKLTFEFEVNAPASLLFSYLTVPKSLKQWFAEDVIEDKDGTINFKWDGEDHIARIAQQKQNQYIRYEFLTPETNPTEPASYIEFRIETNELTQTSFIKITDFYMEESEQDTTVLWKNLITDLKEVLGA